MQSFLKIPLKVHHAVLLVSRLGASYADRTPVSLAVVAEETGLSQGFLEEIAGGLRRANIIEGKRGGKGGYRLCHAPADITVQDVIEAIEGPTSMVDCLDEQVGCVLANACTNRTVWDRVQSRVLATLRDTTIADVIGRGKKHSYARA